MHNDCRFPVHRGKGDGVPNARVYPFGSLTPHHTTMEIRMETMGPKRKKKTLEGINMIKIFERAPPTPELEGTFQFYEDSFPHILESVISRSSFPTSASSLS